MSNAFTLDTVNNLFEENNCFLMSPYKNVKTKLTYICRCGNFYDQTLRQFKITKGCINCSKRVQYRSRTKESKKFFNAYFRLISRIVDTKMIKEHSESLLGYTLEEFENHMKGFDDFDLSEPDWELDHIFPIKAFLDHGIIVIQEKCLYLNNLYMVNHLSNLQPLKARENNIKGSNYNPEEFKNYLKQFNYIPPLNPHNLDFS